MGLVGTMKSIEPYGPLGVLGGVLPFQFHCPGLGSSTGPS